MKNIESHLLETLRIAERAREKGNHPFGALLVHQNQVIAFSENSVVSDGDVTAHAEMNLIRSVFPRVSKEMLKSSVLYSSTEPCAMCCGAIYWAGIRSVVFGCSNKSLSEIVGGTLEISSVEVLRRGREPSQVFGPILEDRFKGVHLGFWTRREV